MTAEEEIAEDEPAAENELIENDEGDNFYLFAQIFLRVEKMVFLHCGKCRDHLNNLEILTEENFQFSMNTLQEKNKNLVLYQNTTNSWCCYTSRIESRMAQYTVNGSVLCNC